MSNYATPTLYGIDSKGNIKVWKGSVINKGDTSVITFEFGLEHGKKQIQNKEITTGKNIGRSNETTPFEQAVKDVESKMNKKMDSGYGEDKDNIKTPILPMLALPFEKRKHNINYPCYIQPKIDGVRMTCRMVDGKIEMFTRKGKPFTSMTHIEDELISIFKRLELVDYDSYYFDGELFSDTLTFQELAGVVRRSGSTEEELKQVKYVVFDCFQLKAPDTIFYTRFSPLQYMLDKHKTSDNSIVSCINTITINSEDEIYDWNTNFIQDGFEGTIIRNTHGLYKMNHRSPDLQKFKTFLDDEYEIVGFTQGTGTDEGCVIWECKTKEGKTFSVRPRGSVAERQGYFNNGNEWIGSQLTVRYQELTDGGIPRFPVGITIRNYE
tara:strand:- start:12443 stop:13585 length:1143 start_codon:yes stop_codon:yes gene_type:complete